jgi:uncharacterized membrane protein
VILADYSRSPWLLFVHVAAAFLFLGGALTLIVASVSAAHARSLRETALLARLAARVDVLIVWPALVVLVGAGAQLASDEEAYGNGWLTLGIALTAVVAIAAGVLVSWLNRRRLRLVEQALASGDESSGTAQSPMLVLLGTVSLVLLVVIFWLMTAKPGGI